MVQRTTSITDEMTDLMIGGKAPEPELDEWLQGDASSLQALSGQVILIEFFQVNCPGCFAHALPEAARLHEAYGDKGLTVLGIATAFEEFEHNTAHNLRRLLETGELQGAPLEQLGKAGYLEDGRLPYRIPFAIATDRLIENRHRADDEAVEAFILSQVPDFYTEQWSAERRQLIRTRAEDYLHSKTHSPQTFERYALQGTPSSIVIDQTSVLRMVKFGVPDGVATMIRELLITPLDAS